MYNSLQAKYGRSEHTIIKMWKDVVNMYIYQAVAQSLYAAGTQFLWCRLYTKLNQKLLLRLVFNCIDVLQCMLG